jgi:hypothetical protein
VRSYLVEIYLPRSRAHGASDTARRARRTTAELACEGVAIRYVRTTFLPDDEMGFHIVEALAAEAVGELCRRAGLEHVRIVTAVDV